MKKFLFITAFCFLFALSCSAKNGDITGTIYSSDILATINGTPVESFNIGGKTVIILEDLQKNGATIRYSDSLRTLLVDFLYINNMSEPVTRGTSGKVTGNIYESDIKTLYNGIPLHTFSLNGKMAAAIEDIGNNNDFSNYGAKFVWDGTTRTIALTILVDNSKEVVSFVEQKKIFATIHNDTIKLESPHFVDSGYYATFGTYDDGFDKNRIYPVYVNGEQVGIHFPIHYTSSHQDENGMIVFENTFNYDYICYDLPKIIEQCENVVVTKPTYQEVLDYYNMDCVFNAKDTVYTNEYTFLIGWYQSGKSSHSYRAIRICANGDYHDYVKDLNNLGVYNSLYNHTFQIDKVNQTVTFSSANKTATLDLKTGVLQESPPTADTGAVLPS